MYCVCLTMQAYYVCTEVLCTDKNRTSDEREKSKYNSWCFFSPSVDFLPQWSALSFPTLERTDLSSCLKLGVYI